MEKLKSLASSTENVFLFVPNIIGYVRVALALAAFATMPWSPLAACGLYLCSGLLDAVDGHAARSLNQSSKFGAMLDMLTDRCTTMCLLVNLSLLYPRCALLFQLSMAIDVSSHWMHLHSSILQGAVSHKSLGLASNPILHLYYNSRPVLFVMCAGNELFYCLLYLYQYSSGPSVLGVGAVPLLLLVTAPVCLLKTLISCVHLVSASAHIAALDAEERKRRS
uniref:CDP-diacylglycerol--inositol 3-phosphatidyltransferase n=1 Tax=Petromyzon marinus TaxID=7757 RepID=A0AAJ7XJX2_PETMA|nr:CDP-diacylglycerol--inositol 3-phosphatidyltransferase [Petromyzon marinus]